MLLIYMYLKNFSVIMFILFIMKLKDILKHHLIVYFIYKDNLNY
jgi:hypothetical protein